MKLKLLKKLFAVFLICSVACIHAQTNELDTMASKNSLLEKNVFRLNVLSPGIGAEFRTTNFSSLSLNTGITYFPGIDGMNTKNRIGSGSGLGYSFEPFLGVDYKLFYNLQKRSASGKNIAYNSGNFVSLRALTLGPAISNNIVRQSNYDFLLFASWGFQRSYQRIHLLFDAGPVFVFDAKGNKGFYPILFRVNLGYNF